MYRHFISTSVAVRRSCVRTKGQILPASGATRRYATVGKDYGGLRSNSKGIEQDEISNFVFPSRVSEVFKDPNEANRGRRCRFDPLKGQLVVHAKEHEHISDTAKTKPSKYESRHSTPNLRWWPYYVPNIWLRDHCQCHECVLPETKQRQLDTFSLGPESLAIKNCEMQSSRIRVIWKDGHESLYDTRWLEGSFGRSSILRARQGWSEPIWWNEDFLQNSGVPYEAVMNSDEGIGQLLQKIRDHGFAFVDGCPATPEDTQTLTERIGPIRNTHYGSFWDFTSNLASKDTAYTDYALDVHTDSTYFTDPAGLQIFHLLSHEGEGGANQLVDGYHAAQILFLEDPAAYRALQDIPIMAHASGNEDISIQPAEPMHVLSHSRITHELMQVRWNNYDRSQVCAIQGAPELLEEWYKAAAKWNEILHREDKSLRYEVQLQPGRPLSESWSHYRPN